MLLGLLAGAMTTASFLPQLAKALAYPFHPGYIADHVRSFYGGDLFMAAVRHLYCLYSRDCGQYNHPGNSLGYTDIEDQIPLNIIASGFRKTADFDSLDFVIKYHY